MQQLGGVFSSSLMTTSFSSCPASCDASTNCVRVAVFLATCFPGFLYLAAMALALAAALAGALRFQASELSRTQPHEFVKCAELPSAESEPCMLNLLQVAENKHPKGDKKKANGRGVRGGQGILLSKSTFEHDARKLVSKANSRAQHSPKVKRSQNHGPKWEARYGDSDEQSGIKQPAAKRLTQKQDPDTGGEAAAAARAEASGADDDGKRVDETGYQESDASSNPNQPLPAPPVCTGPDALAGDPACAATQAAAATVATADTTPPEVCIAIMAGVSDEWCITNCAIDNCPASMCDCSGGKTEEVDPNKPVCNAIAPNVSDEWCQTNCERWVAHEEGFFNCPPSQCKCTEHQSQQGGAEHDTTQRMGYMKASPPDADATAATPQ